MNIESHLTGLILQQGGLFRQQGLDKNLGEFHELPLLFFKAGLHGRHGAFQQDQLLVAEDLQHAQTIRRGQRDAGDVAGGAGQGFAFLGGHDESLVQAQSTGHFGKMLGLGFGQFDALDHQQVSAARRLDRAIFMARARTLLLTLKL